MKRILISLAALAMLSAMPVGAHAVTNGFEAMSFRPTADDSRYQGVWDSYTLPSGKPFVGTVFSYAYRPFQIVNGSDRNYGVIDHALVEHFVASVGIVDRWLEAGLEFPVAWWLKERNPDVAGSPWQNKTVTGDIRLNFKVNFVDADRYGIGVALVPYIGLPTGKGGDFFGNGGVSGGGTAIVEGKPIGRMTISLNAGILAKRLYDYRDVHRSYQLTSGLGVAVDATKHLIASAEIAAKTRLSGPFKEKVNTPVEALGGLSVVVS